jgi:glutamate dehydrogenase
MTHDLDPVWGGAVRAALLDHAELVDRFAERLPAGYDELNDAALAAVDLTAVDSLDRSSTELATRLLQRSDGGWRFRVYRQGPSIPLADLLPLLDQLGLRALDERAFHFPVADGNGVDRPGVWLHDVGVDVVGGAVGAAVLTDDMVDELRRAFEAAFRGEIEVDGLNRLVLLAGLTARHVEILRAYSRYLRQISFPFSQQYIESALCRHPAVAAMFVRWFEQRLRPGADGDAAATHDEINAALDAIPSLDDDRTLRAISGLIAATLRTNAFQAGRDGRTHPAVMAVKLDTSLIPDLPLPRPMFEIWVCSPRVEGVHLRNGRIARGGIRWSDRREDFRTEILGLVKAQIVKNAVIVPTGAKGGFVLKRPPAQPDGLRAEGVACYREFIGGLLDITDNLVAGEVVPPADTVRHDGDDPYLVVAADKGTATFSDIANGIAADYGFWLGDAFASGGSAGYDHKVMGITARGAWESVRRHARTLGKNADRDELTVVGIGDMSGDVFGNGMLLSPHLKLVAAFDHRHIFIDPTPAPAAAHAERARLFAMPRSSWADYDVSQLSPGGGVFPRTLKSISLSAESRKALGAEQDVFTPAELISAILMAPVDLLWNGGIGTYVKASGEAHSEAGDRANDVLRVNGSDLRCKMVGEGGNLGFTQRARVEYALAGGLINTDAIDNSAGVDCSDHEVNIKIALGSAVAAGMTVDERNDMLTSMTTEVGDLVLDDNKAQTLALAIARRQALPMVNVHARYLNVLEQEGWLSRAQEFLPTDKQLAERQSGGQGLTTPEFAVLLAYTKSANTTEMVGTDLPDDPYLLPELLRYFPTSLRSRFPEQIKQHRLRREIIATQVANQMVNLSGISFDNRMSEDTGASVVDVMRAWVAARDIFGLVELWEMVENLEDLIRFDTQIEMFLEVRRMAERGALWLLRHRRPPIDIAMVVAEFRSGIAALSSSLASSVRGRMREQMFSVEASRLSMGVSEELAERSVVWPLLHTGFDIIDVANRYSHTVAETADAYWQMFEQLDVYWLWEAIGALPRADRWQTQARSALRDDLLVALADLADDALSVGGATQWVAANERVVGRARTMFTEIRRGESFNLTTLSVALRQLRNLALIAERTPR